jgi:hypothetical protein
MVFVLNSLLVKFADCTSIHRAEPYAKSFLLRTLPYVCTWNSLCNFSDTRPRCQNLFSDASSPLLHSKCVSSPNAFGCVETRLGISNHQMHLWTKQNAFGDNYQHEMHFGMIAPTSEMQTAPKCISLRPNASRDVPNGFSFSPSSSGCIWT